ncbi:patatin-like phospholipase family protein [Nitrococcus mobilis]|uniref:Latex allergen from Hevea brasiliensis n=1 Tax=Nitrococcus mobilis Nb-231 TaxID=314278 RepID=A4BNF7_9GAMM|nr:patatin-like phospholipase family protein [Nitrococcus mobilis]EAR22756.1 latex allergen from Hevea brasiliensis [Nitrococcus mobilis Nb-231]
MGEYRILALDGGGVRGVVTAVLLERLLKVAPSLIGVADLLAGTSSGGILALGLAGGLSPTQLRQLYERKGQAIFHDSRRPFGAEVGQRPTAAYDNGALCRELKGSLGEATRLADLHKQVLVPACDLDNEAVDPWERTWRPKLFHNLSGSEDADRLVYRVALYTSAAPMYFPSVDGFIDGGVYANNPSMVAIAHAVRARCEASALTLPELRVLSLGNGNVGRYISGRRHDWGSTHWLGAGLLDLMNDASVAITDFQCRQLLRERYFRFAPLLPMDKPILLDESARLPELVDYAEHLDLSELAAWLEENW